MAPSPKKVKSPAPAPSGRPPLPLAAANASIRPNSRKRHEVKVQELKIPQENGKEETKVLIARVRIPMPKGKDTNNALGHVIKRFDTNALSAYSLFKAAFPNATDEEVEIEMQWIKSGQYGDTRKANREGEADNAGVLAGTWIPMEYAEMLALEYGTITKYVKDLFEFTPPAPNQEISTASPKSPKSGAPVSPRRSIRSPTSSVPNSTKSPPSSRGSTKIAPTPAVALGTVAVKSPPAKRARVGSPKVTRSTSRPPISNGDGGEVKVTQTVTVDKERGTETEKTEVVVSLPTKADQPEEEEQRHLPPDEEIAEQLERGRKLVESLKEGGLLSKGSASTTAVGTTNLKKRGLDEVEEETQPKEGGSGWLSGVWKRRREAKQLERQVVVVPEDNSILNPATPARRRTIAAFGLAVGVAATAAVPYFFG